MEGTLNQPYILAAAMYAGMAAGVAYSILRCFRALLRGRVWTVALDALFLFLLLGITGGALYVAADLQLRAYHFLGVAIGFGIAVLGICPIFRYVDCKFFKAQVDKFRKKRFNKQKGGGQSCETKRD